MEQKVLSLTVSKQWFDMIAAGDKIEEYREIKPYWIKRLTTNCEVPYDVAAETNFVKISNTAELPYNCVSLVSGRNSSYKYCIPYEGNESLAFTDYDFEDLPF